MSLLGRLFGFKPSKTELVGQLVRDRIENTPEAWEAGVTPEVVDSLHESTLMGLPEATIVTIVESYVDLGTRGLREAEALGVIEATRSELMGEGDVPMPPTLWSYVRYRVDLEYSDSAYLSKEHFDTAMNAAIDYFK